MAGETQNTAEIAVIAATELFSEFFWMKVGEANHSWPCEDSERHEVTEHPCDVVFYYDEPYSAERTYVHCDLKSYAKGTIRPPAVKAAVESLAMQVACAEKSDTWREKHGHDRVTASICGLLFVYNHDGLYDAEFQNIVQGISSEKLLLPKGSKIFVLGPKEIFWLDNIRDDIQRMRGKNPPQIPPHEFCSFFHPQLVRRANLQGRAAKAATLEMLTSPLIIFEYRDPRKPGTRGVIVFYSRRGEKADEFMYLIDTLRKYELLDDMTTITVKTLEASVNSSPTFQRAQQQYIEGISRNAADTNLARFVDAIRYETMAKVKSTYSVVDVGTWS